MGDIAGEFPNGFLLINYQKRVVSIFISKIGYKIQASATDCSSISERNTVVRLKVEFECWTKIWFLYFG